eukprot:TRINITY_DN10715_c0_g1_i1.p1 TRINITY_DN10715_c0_g1~~TRINITY_DN10715_c0_g1_i1.p1  ORF type:complete len:427 (+),score=79.07 TRINITY_DN10715_c0_g1_i1:166-1446(+)
METSFQAAEPLTPVALEATAIPSWMTTNDDQRFLLLFIMGTYFGPDLKAEKPKKSVLQRIAEGLPPYSSDQLAGSQMKAVEVERVYYYVLRKGDQSVIVKLPLLHQFFQGSLYSQAKDSTDYQRQFPDLFPSHLHLQSRYKTRFKIIENIVFINNPEISYIKPEDVERFKRLTGLEDLLLDRDAARLYGGVGIGGFSDDLTTEESNGKLPLRRSSQRSRKKWIENDHSKTQQPLPPVWDAPFSSLPDNNIPYSNKLYDRLGSLPTKVKAKSLEKVGPAMLFLRSHPTTEEWTNIVNASKTGIAFTGSVAEMPAGPLIGLVDIGACEDAYLFRISLPGVKKDEREFSCEVEADGRVLIKGVTTTGQRLIFKEPQVFEMQTQHLCPSGHFSVSFQLPGPVEPQEFSGNFGSDGILEGIVMKERMMMKL